MIVSLLALLSAPAAAFDEFPGIRPLGMGGASRAWAVGDAGPLLNPSGMSLLKNYTVEGDYAYGRLLSESVLHASIVDGTSTYNLGGGVYYTYHLVSPSGGPSGHSHDAGFALSLPFGEIVALGATVKYLRFEGDDAGAGDHTGGVTFDLGTTVRPGKGFSLALVGNNLVDLQNGEAPRGIAYGAAFIPIPSLLFALDGRTNLTADNKTGRKGTSVMAGGELTLLAKLGVRLGGGYDASTGNGYLSAGLSGLSEVGAFDAGLRQDVFQQSLASGGDAPRETIVGVSLRLFVPASQTPPNE